MDIEFFDFEIFDLDESSEISLSGPENASVSVVLKEDDYEAHQELLKGILTAIQYDLNTDVQVCLLRQAQNVNLSRIIKHQNQKVIVFGINPKRISMNASFKAYHLYRTETFQIMLSHSLESLSTNKSYKKALWNELQQKFMAK